MKSLYSVSAFEGDNTKFIWKLGKIENADFDKELSMKPSTGESPKEKAEEKDILGLYGKIGEQLEQKLKEEKALSPEIRGRVNDVSIHDEIIKFSIKAVNGDEILINLKENIEGEELRLDLQAKEVSKEIDIDITGVLSKKLGNSNFSLRKGNEKYRLVQQGGDLQVLKQELDNAGNVVGDEVKITGSLEQEKIIHMLNRYLDKYFYEMRESTIDREKAEELRAVL